MKQFKKNQEIKVYHDGKSCRGLPATVISPRSYGIQVKFTPNDEEEITVWFRRKSKAGKFEADGWNYWIIPRYS